MDGVENVSFNVYADNVEEAEELRRAIIGFIDWFGKRNIKVKAGRVANALKGWESNKFVRDRIIKYICDER